MPEGREMIDQRMVRDDDRYIPVTRSGEERFRHPGPDARSEVSCRPEPPRAARESESSRPERR